MRPPLLQDVTSRKQWKIIGVIVAWKGSKNSEKSMQISQKNLSRRKKGKEKPKQRNWQKAAN